MAYATNTNKSFFYLENACNNLNSVRIIWYVRRFNHPVILFYIFKNLSSVKMFIPCGIVLRVMRDSNGKCDGCNEYSSVKYQLVWEFCGGSAMQWNRYTISDR